MLYSYLRKSKAYFDGTRVLIDGGKTFRDFIRANKDSQRLIKKLILQVSGKAIPIGPYEPEPQGKPCPTRSSRSTHWKSWGWMCPLRTPPENRNKASPFGEGFSTG